MQVFVRGTDGKHVAIDVEAGDSIEALKQKIQAKLGFPARDQLLTYSGKPLGGGNLLDYSIQKDCTINLAVAVQGG